MEYMRTAEVLNERPIGIGINRSVKVTLEQDGVRSNAIFREVDVRRNVTSIDDVHYQLFADSYLFECAAYELATMIDLPRVPPAVLRTIGDRGGSLQIWLEDTLDEESDAFQPPIPREWVGQLWDMYFFDNLLYNIDRNLETGWSRRTTGYGSSTTRARFNSNSSFSTTVWRVSPARAGNGFSRSRRTI